MKLLHTADWHLGRSLCGASLLGEQEDLLDKLLELVEQEKPDAFLIAGDVYDRAVPPGDAVALLNKFLTNLVVEQGVPTFVIAGNHDSPQRVGFANQLLEKSGLYIIGQAEATPRAITLKDSYGPVTFYAVPYVEPAEAALQLGTDIPTAEAALQALLAEPRARAESGRRTVLLTHAFVAGGESGESERPLMVGGAETVSPSLFSPFTYVALGHLHHQQHFGERIRYSGSLYPYAFDEWRQQKAVTRVEIDADGTVSTEAIPLQLQRALQVMRGTFEEILAAEPCEDYLRVELEDERVIFEPFRRLKERHPNLLEMDYVRRAHPAAPQMARPRAQRSDLELFSDFFRDVAGQELDGEQQQELEAVINSLLAEEREQA